MAIVFSGGLSACTTIDLSQVAFEQAETVSEKPKLNVVERATHALTENFRSKGWCKNSPEEKTKTATNVLLNGMQDTQTTPVPAVVIMDSEQLNASLVEANAQVVQATKAAEVYLNLTMADGMAVLDTELSQLETALLSARQAQVNFSKSLKISDEFLTRQKFDNFSSSVDNLKSVTDAYGDRIRSQIAMRAAAERS